MMTMLKKFWMEEDGGELVEWPLLVALIAIGLIIAITTLRDEIANVLGAITGELQDAQTATIN